MSYPTSLNNLFIIGYADRTLPVLCPCVVPPVFVIDNDVSSVLRPPFKLVDNFVIGGFWDDKYSWLEDVMKGKVTQIEVPIKAQPNYVLWLDSEMALHYDQKESFDAKMKTFSEEHIQMANEYLKAGDLNMAVKKAAKAFNADARRVDPLLMKAAIRKYEGVYSEYKFLFRMAERRLTKEGFDFIVDGYIEIIKKAKTENGLTINVTTDFSVCPGPRHISEGKFSGEQFRLSFLVPSLNKLAKGTKLTINLDGGTGYGCGFLEAAFGGLIRDGYKTDDIVFISTEQPSLIKEINGYIEAAKEYKEGSRHS